MKKLSPIAAALAGASLAVSSRRHDFGDDAPGAPSCAISAADFDVGTVINPNQSEIIGGTLYDSLLYPTAGSTQLTFFSTQVGAGNTTAPGATAATPKTFWDTNMTMSSTLPNGSAYLVKSIEVLFLPGSVSTANTYTAQVIGDFTVAAADATFGWSNDVNAFYTGGLLELNVYNKNYVREQPLLMFPPQSMLSIESSQGNNSATVGSNILQVASVKGMPYMVDPFITLKPAVNFEVLLKWPAVVATPSGFNGRVITRLGGWWMRASQ